MRKFFIFIVACITQQVGVAQPNCYIVEDPTCKKACEILWLAKENQGSRQSQELFDSSIAMCPTIAYAYFEKSVPYLKQGLFKEWKLLMDKAVELEPSYLLQRGTNQVQFIRNYKAGLEDLNRLVEIKKTIDIGDTPSGDYHAQMLRAICYQKLGDTKTAIRLVEEFIESEKYVQRQFDFFHIGIMYLEFGQLEKSEDAFARQISENEFAETYYYLAEVHKQKGALKEQKEMLEKAQFLYQKNITMQNRYYHHIDKVFLSDINEALAKLM